MLVLALGLGECAMQSSQTGRGRGLLLLIAAIALVAVAGVVLLVGSSLLVQRPAPTSTSIPAAVLPSKVPSPAPSDTRAPIGANEPSPTAIPPTSRPLQTKPLPSPTDRNWLVTATYVEIDAGEPPPTATRPEDATIAALVGDARGTIVAAMLTPALLSATAIGAVVDETGRYLGEGTVLVYGFTRINQPNNPGELIMVELTLTNNRAGTPVYTEIPAPTATPFGTLQPSWTPAPQISGGRLNVFEFMSVSVSAQPAGLLEIAPKGVDLTQTEIDPNTRRLPTDGSSVRYRWLFDAIPRKLGTARVTVSVAHRPSMLRTAPRLGIEEYTFNVEVYDREQRFSMALLLTGAGVMAVAMAIGVFSIRGIAWRRERKSRTRVRLHRDAIFISYRRQDNPMAVGRIYGLLAAYFGGAAVFRDLEITIGEDFEKALDEKLKSCNVALVMIGQHWLDELERHKSAKDYVLREVEAALQKGERGGCTVIPVLIGGAAMPAANQLPPSIEQLAYKNAATVRNDPDFEPDMARLIAGIESKLMGKRKRS